MTVDLKAAARRLRTIELEEFGGDIALESWGDALQQIDAARSDLLNGLVDVAQGRQAGFTRARDAATTAALLLLALAEQLRER